MSLEPDKLFSKVKFKLLLDIVVVIIPIWLVDNWFVSVSMNDCAINELLPLLSTRQVDSATQVVIENFSNFSEKENDS